MTYRHLPALGKVFFVAFLCFSFSSNVFSQTLKQTPITDSVNYAIGGYYECLPNDYNDSAAKKYPLMIFLHGIGELGDGSQTSLPQVLKNGPPKLINRNLFPDSFVVNGKAYSFIVISPQLKNNYRNADVVSTLIDYCVKKYRVDESRIYLTGLSMGGGISWIYAAKAGDADRLAALLVVCGNTNASSTGIANIATSNLPTWATHNLDDPTVPSYNSINWINGLNAYTPAINPKALLNIFNSASHDAWTKTYDPNFKPNGLNVYEWMLQYQRNNSDTIVANQPPIANAGADTIVTLPVNAVNLKGTGIDNDGTIDAFEWTQLSGPAEATLTNTNRSDLSVTDLLQGVYIFRLTVTDNSGAKATDDVQVLVNAAKINGIANAGKDTLFFKNQTRPDSVLLDGTASSDASSYIWAKISGPGSPVISNATEAKTYVTGFEEGVYEFKLTVNGSASDTVTVTVRDWQKKNVSPCRPGGGKSFVVPVSSDGKYNRLYINRDNLVGERVMGGDTLFFKGGTYSAFEIGDFGGGYGCPVYVLPKDAPVIVKEGYFRIAIRDSNVVQHVVMDGTSLRSKGIPYGFIMDNSRLPLGNVPYSNLVAGWVSNFTLKGYRSYNTGILQIKLDAREPAFGRYDKFIENRIILSDNFINYSTAEGLYIGHTAPEGGQAGNPYGPPPRMDSVEISNNIIMNCAWDGIQLANARSNALIKNNFVYNTGLLNQPSQRAGILLGGNASGNIDSNIVINAKGSGIQVFGYGQSKLTGNVIDSVYSGEKNGDGIYQSYIATSPEENVPLSVNNYGNLSSRIERNHIMVANNSKTMTPGSDHDNYFIHPTEKIANSLVVDNTGGSIYNNTVINYFPFKVQSISMTGIGVNISMKQGNATGSFSSVKQTIDWLFSRLKDTSATNQPPVANAGSDKTITLPTSSVTLSGSGSDADGSISKYAWTKTAGPSGAVISSPSSASTSVTALVQGSYTFRLTVTDNGGATAYNDVNVTVNAPINKLPNVDAGADKTIILPVDSVLLQASAIDTDGTITTYAWRKISGPDSFEIINPSQSETLVKSLVYGTYNFEVMVTDDKGAVAKDTVWVKVDILGGRLNMAPTASAGADQQINLPANTVLLSGLGKDADGEIKAYQWKKINGPQSGVIVDFTAAKTEVRSLVQGIYLFELTVTDNDGATAIDTVAITVNAEVVSKKPPVANAGTDITIIPPVDSVILDGHATDADGYILTYSWKKISGPALFTITDVAKAKTKVIDLVPGIYKFELKVTDNDGLVASDTVSVTVDASFAKLSLTVNAGEDRIISLPKDSVHVKCVADDPFGLITGYSWKKVSGPSQYKIDSASNSKTIISGLQAGVYQFECTVSDKYNNVIKDTVQISVRNLISSKASVYPNPAINRITLKIEANTVTNQTKVCIYNQYGQQVYSESFMRTAGTIEKEIDVSLLVKGVYFIETGVDINNKVTLKLIKQ
jgi:dienelactone hydrolase